MPLPPVETCSECGKTISGRAKANVWEEQRIVCTRCFAKLEKARQAAGVKAREGLAPTQRQLDFARELGVVVPPNVTRGQVSALIDLGIRRRDEAEADDEEEEDEAGPPLPPATAHGEERGCLVFVVLAAVAGMTLMWIAAG